MALTTCSASFSSITSPTWGYEVFVSYYGDDTRTGFTDHLFAALRRSQIRTFRDDTEIERGNDIWTDLEKAIEMSRITVIVFSRDYAASSWCLKELEKIMECKRRLQHVNVYCVMSFRPNYFTCTAHSYLYCTLLVPHTYASYIRHWCIFSH